VLGRVTARICGDWQAKYGHPICLLESFVERGRFRGCCYEAANWLCVGQTQGRSRNDRQRSLLVPRKDVDVRALHRRFRRLLQEPLQEADPGRVATTCSAEAEAGASDCLGLLNASIAHNPP